MAVATKNNNHDRQEILQNVGSKCSVTRWLDYLFNIWLFTQVKICPKKRVYNATYGFIGKSPANLVVIERGSSLRGHEFESW